ncbi:hypothetical protein MP959_21085 [Escherichia coli]|nr:hypothetical protein [Escherichia coli]
MSGLNAAQAALNTASR